MLCWANVVLFAMLGYLLRCAGLFAMLFAMFFVLLFASMLLLLSPASHAMYDNMYALLLSQQPFAVVLLIATVLNLRLILRSCHLVANDGRVDMGNDKPFKSGHAADHTEIIPVILTKSPNTTTSWSSSKNYKRAPPSHRPRVRSQMKIRRRPTLNVLPSHLQYIIRTHNIIVMIIRCRPLLPTMVALLESKATRRLFYDY